MESHIEDEEVITPAFPVRPGHVLRYDVLPARKVTGVALSDAIKTPRPSVTNMLNGKARLTADMAARIETATGYSADLLVRMQAVYDLATTKREQADRLAAIPRLAA